MLKHRGAVKPRLGVEDGSLGKGLVLLEMLAAAGEPRGVSELARELGIAKSGVHRLLRLLVEGSWLRQDAEGRYEPTLKIWEIGARVAGRVDLGRVAKPVMRHLMLATGLTANISILDGFEVLCIDKCESAEPIQVYPHIAGRAPAHCSAAGKAQLAWADSVMLSALPSKLERFTARTHTTRAALFGDLEAVRRSGYAINRGEWHIDAFGVASPIWDARASVVASIGVNALAARLTLTELRALGPVVLAHAKRITEELGGRVPLQSTERGRSTGHANRVRLRQ
jgi:IclR family transcriptional regulator, KDG regulon repressor